MHRKIIIIILLTLSFKGYSSDLDTLDYWHVYYNNKVIAKFNSASQDLNIKIDSSNIKKFDTISVRYGKDTRCVKCTYRLFVRNESNRKLRIIKSEEFWGKLSFRLPDLIAVGQKNEGYRYDFYHYETDESGIKPMTLVLQMTLK